jgi:hypothetical protein
VIADGGFSASYFSVMVPRSSNDPPSSALLLLPIRPTDHIFSPGDASYTLVEYGDYECPDCGRLYLPLRDLQKDFAARLRVVLLQGSLDVDIPDDRTAEKRPVPRSWYDSVSTLASVAWMRST